MESGKTMSASSEEYITAVIRKVALLQNVEEWSFVQEKFENIGQNFFGVLVPVIVNGKHDGNKIQMKLVLKLAPTEEKSRVSGAVTVMFAREIFVYSFVFALYHEIQDKMSSNVKFIAPLCYYVQSEFCKEVLVLQDMRTEGFQPYNHEMFLDLDHLIISLKSLAKLHALSFILKDKNPEAIEEISLTCVPLTEQSNFRYMNIMRDRLEKAIMKFEGSKYLKILNKLRDKCAEYFIRAHASVNVTCLCHGDIWKENILFKYQNEKPVAACLIDYQTTRICCPAFDTLYLILSSTSTDLRKKYFPQLFEIYYSALGSMLKEAGLDIEKLYLRSWLESDIKTVAPACVIMANTALWLLNGLQEEGNVRSKVILKTKEEKEAAIHKYKGIIRAILSDLISHNYLSTKDL